MNAKLHFSSVGMVKKQGKFWFAARETNGLFQMDLDGTNLQYIGEFPGELVDQAYLYGKCVSYDGKLFFAPYNANKIAVYDTERKCFDDTFLGEPIYLKGYLVIAVWENYLFLLPEKKSNMSIVKVDLRSGRVTCNDSWKNKFCFIDQSEELFREYCIVENKLYAPVISTEGLILEYNMDSDQSTCIQLSEKQKFRSICYDGKDFYLCEQQGNQIIRWNREKGILEKKNICTSPDITIGTCIYQNGSVYAMTNHKQNSELGDRIIRMDIETGEVCTVIQTKESLNDNLPETLMLSHLFSTVSDDGENKIWALNGGNGVLYEVATVENRVKEHVIEGVDIATIYRQKFENHKTDRNNFFVEKPTLLRELLVFITKEHDTTVEKQTTKDCGTKIWNDTK